MIAFHRILLCEEQDVVRSYELGVNAYVVKPVEFDRFPSAVRELGRFRLLINETPPAPRA